MGLDVTVHADMVSVSVAKSSTAHPYTVAQSSAVLVVVVLVVPLRTIPPYDDTVLQISADSVWQVEGLGGVGTCPFGGMLHGYWLGEARK